MLPIDDFAQARLLFWIDFRANVNFGHWQFVENRVDQVRFCGAVQTECRWKVSLITNSPSLNHRMMSDT